MIKYALAAYMLGLLLQPTSTGGFVIHNIPSQRRRSQNHHSSVSAGSGKNEDARRPSKRTRFLNKMGFKSLSRDRSQIRETVSKKSPKQIYEISSVEELDAYFSDEAHRFRLEDGSIDYDNLLKAISVKGDTQIIGSKNHPDYVHPVAKLLHERKRTNSTCTEGERPDGCKVALVVEGGGMRGCISAGMICAIHHLGLRETVDVVYGSSAGSMIGAYWITEQLPWFGPEVYYDKLTTAGKEFIDNKRLLRSLGFGLVDPRLLKDVMTRPSNGKPVLNLPFLLKKTMQETKRLDWDAFVQRQRVQPLKVVASALKSEEPFIMSMEGGHFSTLDELSDCMHASCLLPGIAGPVMNIKVDNAQKDKPKFVLANNLKDEDYEPLNDALVYAPIPYEAAYKDGATHVIAIRSRPDGTDVTGNGGIIEKLIFKRYFMRKNRLPSILKRMTQHLHKKLYAKNVIELNKAAHSTRDYLDTSEPHAMTIALPPGSEEVTRLETRREAIFEGVRRGFARAYDALVEDPAERGRGGIVAQQCFPDEILSYDPRSIRPSNESAFSAFLMHSEIKPASADALKTVGSKAQVSG